MRSPIFRQLFLALSAFGYAFLGGGPSLWALGLKTPPAACSMAGCHCEAMRHGGACTCALSRALLKRYPELAKGMGQAPVGACEMRSVPLQDAEASDGAYSLPSQQPHTLAGEPAPFSSDRYLALSAPAVGASLFHPEPPTPIPNQLQS